MSRRSPDNAGPGQSIIGPLRVASQTSALVRKLQRGDIAVVDALDIDRATAEALIKRKPVAVLNVQPSLSGRYPAGGAALLAAAGVVLVDSVGAQLLAIPDGTIGTISMERAADAALRHADGETATRRVRATVVAGSVETSGDVLDRNAIADAMEAARAGLPIQLAAFASHAVDTLGTLHPAILNGEGLPSIGLDLHSQHVVVVAPGFDAAAQLRAINAYLKEQRPVVIAVGDGLHTVENLGVQADIVIATADDLGVPALTSAALKGVKHVVAHSPSGAEVATARVDALAVPHSRSELGVSSEDLALLMAHHGGAELIVAVGVESSLVDYVESARAHAAATFLTRLAAGGRVVDADTVSALYRSRVSPAVVFAAMALALVALAAALWVNESSRSWIESLLGLAGQAS